MLVKVNGILEFEPENVTRKHEKQSSWKRIAIIKTNDDLSEYYAWFIRKRFNLELNVPLRGAHLTIINDRDNEVPTFEKTKALYDGKEMSFYVELEPKTNGEHWWLRAYCPEAEKIRVLAGGNPIPYFTFHMTIGYANNKWMDHSLYILEMSKKFELISSEARKPFEEHEIFEF